MSFIAGGCFSIRHASAYPLLRPHKNPGWNWLEDIKPQNVGRCNVECRSIVKRFRGGFVFQAHRLLYRSTLGLKVTKKKEENAGERNHISCCSTMLEARKSLYKREATGKGGGVQFRVKKEGVESSHLGRSGGYEGNSESRRRTLIDKQFVPGGTSTQCLPLVLV